MNILHIAEPIIESLLKDPYKVIPAMVGNSQAHIHINIPDYFNQLQQFYGNTILPDLPTVIHRSGIDFDTLHFGLVICFEEPVILTMHNQALELLGNSKALISQFEVVTIINASLDQESRDYGHRNRFPHLKFHRDRNELQPTPYSLYTRNPFDPEQRKPRISSTVFIANLVAYLQCMKQRDYQQIAEKGSQSHYNIFKEEDISQIIGKVILEHRWDATEGTGEISMLDNRRSLHASFMR
ncbi:MAG: hypothetical protein ACI8WB_006193, partial [Phenylobacterium sp.]